MQKVVIVTVLGLLLAACSGQQEENATTGKDSPVMMNGHRMGNSTPGIAVKQPKVPFQYGLGMRKFRKMCSQCHGEWGEGSDQGPPLMHDFYKPSHHGDPAFYNAVLKGVKAHHWRFGDMPPVAGATTNDVKKILPFIRWLQQENGIY